jgi:hypothetical protein
LSSFPTPACSHMRFHTCVLLHLRRSYAITKYGHLTHTHTNTHTHTPICAQTHAHTYTRTLTRTEARALTISSWAFCP